jgi:CheY-like chemotaxis protein
MTRDKRRSVPALFAGPRLDGVRILIVEDEPDSREMLCEMLELFGAECVTASDAAAARERLSESTPDIVLSDIGLPGEDGYSLLRWILARPRPPPVIAVSAVEQLGARGAGFAAHVLKPIDLPHLLQAALAALKRAPTAPP